MGAVFSHEARLDTQYAGRDLDKWREAERHCNMEAIRRTPFFRVLSGAITRAAPAAREGGEELVSSTRHIRRKVGTVVLVLTAATAFAQLAAAVIALCYH